MSMQIQNNYNFDFISKHKVQYKLSIKSIFCIWAGLMYLAVDLRTTSEIEKKAAMVSAEIYSQTITAHVQYNKALENNEVDKAIDALEKLKKLKTINLKTQLWDVSINTVPQYQEAYLFNNILDINYNHIGENNSYVLKTYPEKLVQYVKNNLSEVVNNLDKTPSIKLNCNWYSAMCMLKKNSQKYEVEKNLTDYKDLKYNLKQEILYKNEHKEKYQKYIKELNNIYHYNLKNKDKPQLEYPQKPFIKYQTINKE